ncbi:DUF1223 domain-containing protein [Granulicella tundricola]|uniref:DUF1223 domain-containing protein n=1 Tax=Granulicella tundricola (strain ATCC BAA-1859 / DSM 23138 / MP5ACTX9) TaxID=1198114 RepID=E8X588_GRATM|nr:DUF1223 domain-containing protein [Granulicella tundricola]ADW68352.1 protein of unknown function DUF1223 [Granulicella tundricola MP5ACTX9]
MKQVAIWLAAVSISGAAWGQMTPAIRPNAVLVELFTSEGCSSCPPADAVLAKLNATRGAGEDGPLIVGLSEHVTYWNRLGWADPFSQELFTSRQNGYGSRMRLDSVYTPQVVVDGTRELVGSDEAGILRAVQASGKAGGVGLKIASAVAGHDGVKVSFEVTGAVPKGAEVYAVVAQDMASTKVQRGENAGRTLKHVSIARNLVRVGALDRAGSREVELPLPEMVEGGRHLVLFVQEAGLGRVLAVEEHAL